jgi:hypothetical protein
MKSELGIVGAWLGIGAPICYPWDVGDPLRLDEAVAALKRDPSHPVVACVEGLTVELRAVKSPTHAPQRSAADVFREVGPWEGERGEELDALFAAVRQRSNRHVRDLP